MINWFGPSPWNAPLCAECPRCDTPVGQQCARCGRAILDGDSGVTMPRSDGPVTFHLTCHLKTLLPHTAWPGAGLVPDETDGLADGVFRCRACGMVYRREIGWLQWTYPPPRPPST